MKSATDCRENDATPTRPVQIFVLASALTAASASAQDAAECVTLSERPIQAIGAIHLQVEREPASLEELARRAAALWNDTGCNGSDRFPRVQLDRPSLPHRRIRVRWEPGFNPAEPRSCGSFGGADIVLYGHTIDPRTRELRSCGDKDRITETLAHELGHALGLRDQNDAACYGAIMSQVISRGENWILPRTVRAFECDAADLAFDTPAERRRSSRRPLLLTSAP